MENSRRGKIYKFEGVDTPIDMSFFQRFEKTWSMTFYAGFFKFNKEIINFLLEDCGRDDDENGICLEDILNIPNIRHYCLHNTLELFPQVSNQIFYRNSVTGPLNLLKDGYFKLDNFLYDDNYSKLSPQMITSWMLIFIRQLKKPNRK